MWKSFYPFILNTTFRHLRFSYSFRNMIVFERGPQIDWVFGHRVFYNVSWQWQVGCYNTLTFLILFLIEHLVSLFLESNLPRSHFIYCHWSENLPFLSFIKTQKINLSGVSVFARLTEISLWIFSGWCWCIFTVVILWVWYKLLISDVKAYALQRIRRSCFSYFQLN